MVRRYGVLLLTSVALATTQLACQAEDDAGAESARKPRADSETQPPPAAAADSIGVLTTATSGSAAAASVGRPGIRVVVNGGAALVLGDTPATWTVAAVTTDGSSRKLAIVSVASRGLSSATAQAIGVASTTVTVQRDGVATAGALIVNVRDVEACEPVYGPACADTAAALPDMDVAHEAAWTNGTVANGSGVDPAVLGIGIAVAAIDLFAGARTGLGQGGADGLEEPWGDCDDESTDY